MLLGDELLKAIRKAYEESRAQLLNARTSARLTNWRDPAMQARLADAYSRARDHEEAARLLGVTVGAVRLAKRRYLDRAAADTRPTGPYKPAGRRSLPEVPP